MNTKNMFKTIGTLMLTMGLVSILFTSCKDDDEDLRSMTYTYAFNTGQVGAGTAYSGTHPGTLTATLTIDEMDDGGSMVTVKLTNTIAGETYAIHAHDAADPATTPNGTPYNETPNSNLLVRMTDGTGGELTATQETDMSYDMITTEYEGFFVVHDPLQPINTADISTYLVVGSFARE